MFGKVGGEERFFLIQNMFPTIEKYIEEVSDKITVTNKLEREIKEKANLVLEIAKKGKKVVFPDIIKMSEILLEEIEIKSFTNNISWYIITKTKEEMLCQF